MYAPSDPSKEHLAPQATESAPTEGRRVSEPRWPAVIAALSVGMVYATVPMHFAVGPRWLPLTLITLLIIPTMISHRRGNQSLNRILGHITEGMMTLFMLMSLTLLI